jgi:uncharacterized Ntn-hydrolase superfamily protein
MTYSIIARCPCTGRLGIGTTTTSLACGRRNESVRPNVGISKSQAMYVRAHDPRALNLLALGFTPSAVMRVVEANDDDFSYRQTGIIDREGNVVAHTGAKCGKWAGHKVGPYYAAFGNWLSGPAVVEGLVDGFMSDPQLPLEDRLLLALEGGRKAGGQAAPGNPKAERSAWLRVVDRHDYPEIDLRVDMHTDTVTELRLLLQEFRLYQSYYLQRSRNPQEAVPEETFVAQLQLAVGASNHSTRPLSTPVSAGT